MSGKAETGSGDKPGAQSERIPEDSEPVSPDFSIR